MQITVCHDGREVMAKILDVSERGMKLFIKNGLPVGWIVGLRTPDFIAAAEVRWSRHSHTGLALTEPLSPDQLLQLLGGPSRDTGVTPRPPRTEPTETTGPVNSLAQRGF
ncbi:hypothetical protein JANAI62_26470 [Jannaschia pagri]|uniref:PilZ domain-containing protein n=2 Tax=Roseobacteraceae TaxID=2854170 RepID=A0ABQ4NNQ1_9RHOB|nr:hypothetical protein JANAI61_26470 [Jannaschia sp. AI_61]GIT96024.1 hypothetical protein JANAI62_26470 [Jannaschia sp. AI_62]